MSPSNSNGTANGHSTSNHKNYIEHRVSKMDTLAGVAIKYGVEVADIKRLNGLATDLQMFALKVLLIPLPGRHPPSPVMSNGSSPPGRNDMDKMPPRSRYSSILESLETLRLKSPQQKVSPAMSTLQKYYGLGSSNHKNAGEGTEMAVYRRNGTERSDDLSEALLPKASSISGPPYPNYRSRNSSNIFLPENVEVAEYMPLAEAGDTEGEKSSEKSVRRRQKAETDSKTTSPLRFLKENFGESSGFSAATGKGLAMRPKSASRTSLALESEAGWLNSIPVGMGDSLITDGPAGVRKSSSTPSLQDPDNSNSSSVWPTAKWSLKTDLQAFSNAAITIPIFDGLPNPISGRRNKAALD